MSLSIPFEELLADHLADQNQSTPYDCLIIGSGYGGAMAARTFSRCTDSNGEALKIAVLERGKEYLPGSFPANLGEAIGEFSRPNLPTITTEDAESQTQASQPSSDATGAELPTHQEERNIWANSHDGLYDVRTSETHWILGGNGVGGGSLINAGVMLAPTEQTLANDNWPDEARRVLSDQSFITEVEQLLGSRLPDNTPSGIANTVEHANVITDKYRSMETLGYGECDFVPTPVTIKLSKNEPNQAIKTDPCIHCGNCFSGCNFNAKKSLDTNLLAEARQQGVTIVNGAETLYFEEEGDLWAVYVVFSSSQLRQTQPVPLKLLCKRLVVAAGSIGSTELLLRSQYKAQQHAAKPLFSSELGEHFYGNGDMIASVVNRSNRVNMVADDGTADRDREIGPTNSATLYNRGKPRVILQELAVPGVLQRLMIEGISVTRVRDALTNVWQALASRSANFLKMTRADVDNITLVASIGGDLSKGDIKAQAKRTDEKLKFSADNYQRWLPDAVLSFDDQVAANQWKAHRGHVLELLHRLRKKNDPGAHVSENPIGNPLGEKIGRLFGVDEASSGFGGLMMSVHPLGGCRMAETVGSGVVNTNGQVFRAGSPAGKNSTVVFENLVVLDGAIVPSPTDVNPALSIAALTLNASRNLAREWGWSSQDLTAEEPVERPAIRAITPAFRKKIQPTELSLSERLTGEVWLETDSGLKEYVAEMKLVSKPFPTDQFHDGQAIQIELLDEAKADVAGKLPAISTLRLFKKADWDAFQKPEGILARRKMLREAGKLDQWTVEQRLMLEETEHQLQALAEISVTLGGTVTIMNEMERSVFKRFTSGAYAYFAYRGIRDIVQSFQIQSKSSLLKKITGFVSKIANAFVIFLHTGRERQLNYDLTVSEVLQCEGHRKDAWQGKRVVGIKQFRYQKHTNPVNQLMSIKLTHLPQLCHYKPKSLLVDLGYFAETNVPLFHINRESDAVTGYGDLLSFGAWFSKMALLHHIWMLRKPDTPNDFPESMRPAEPNRTPKALAGVSGFEYYPAIPVADPNGKHKGDTVIRLSRYWHGESEPKGEPVLCVHGFSLSWSMYAHETLYGGQERDTHGKRVKGGLAAYLARAGHDVWVIDMRSSGSVDTAKTDWDFEEAAFIDLPVALEYIAKKTGKSKVNVMSHCMGAMKVSMLMMCSETHFNKYNTAHDLKHIRKIIGRIVLSQAGPYVRFSPANRMRERILSVAKNYDNFDLQFRESEKTSPVEDFLDRLLNAMPYPENELKIENPLVGNRFWVRGRHRMDALYGKTFSLKNMDLAVLDRFHDFFGPLSIRMLEQVIWFARRNQISTRYGGEYRSLKTALKKNWDQETLWIHGEENELLDPMSPVLTSLVFDELGMDNLRVQILKEFGHQDCMMGKRCELPYSLISDHLHQGFEVNSKSIPSPAGNRVVKLDAISRQVIEDEQFVFLENHQSGFNYMHRLAFIPAELQVQDDGVERLTLELDGLQFVNSVEHGKFCVPPFNLDKRNYLVVGIMPDVLVPDMEDFIATNLVANKRETSSYNDHDDAELIRTWADENAGWVKSQRALVYA